MRYEEMKRPRAAGQSEADASMNTVQGWASENRCLLFGWLSFLAIFQLSVNSAVADLPANNCEVQPADALNGLVLAPLQPNAVPASINTVTVRNSTNHPIPGAQVEFVVATSSLLCGATSLVGVTNGLGEVTITLGGGGCANDVALSGLVKANGVTVRSYDNVKSPDYDGSGGNLIVNLADLIDFSNEFLGSSPSDCHDYDNSGGTNLGDLIIFSPTFVNPNSCVP